jgi:5-methylcytosine-specific restriction endonuclease McrA
VAKRKQRKGEWSPNGYIFGALRRIWRWSPERKAVIDNAKACAICGSGFASKKDLVVDHIEPVVPVSGFTTWDTYIHRLFCNRSNLQSLHKACHSAKSKAENAERRKIKKEQSK